MGAEACVWSQFGSEEEREQSSQHCASPWDTPKASRPSTNRATAQTANSVPTHGPPSQRPLRNTPVAVISSKALSCDMCLNS